MEQDKPEDLSLRPKDLTRDNKRRDVGAEKNKTKKLEDREPREAASFATEREKTASEDTFTYEEDFKEEVHEVHRCLLVTAVFRGGGGGDRKMDEVEWAELARDVRLRMEAERGTEWTRENLLDLGYNFENGTGSLTFKDRRDLDYARKAVSRFENAERRYRVQDFPPK